MCRLHGKKGFMEEVYHFTSDKGYLKPRCLPSGVYRQGQVGGFPNSDHPYVNCCGPLQSLVRKWEVSRKEH